MHFIFVHGWGMDKTVWDALLPHLPDINATLIDLGFIGYDINTDLSQNKPRIFITHSLGTAWTLKRHYGSIDALISINGFANFKNYSDERTLNTMQKRLKRSPSAQMKSFWNACDLPQNMQNALDPHLNIDRLHTGLDWLLQWDESTRLKDISAPILSLAGQNDRVAPLLQAKQEWQSHTLKIHEEAGHTLPLSHPEWCAHHIKEFISGIELEK